MLKVKPKFDLYRDVECDILRKEASVCRVKGEAFTGSSIFFPSVFTKASSKALPKI